MHVIDPAFGSSDMQASGVEVDLIPPQATYFRSTKPMPVCDQDPSWRPGAHSGNACAQHPGAAQSPSRSNIPWAGVRKSELCAELSGFRWLRGCASGRILPCESTSAWVLLSV